MLSSLGESKIGLPVYSNPNGSQVSARANGEERIHTKGYSRIEGLITGANQCQTITYNQPLPKPMIFTEADDRMLDKRCQACGDSWHPISACEVYNVWFKCILCKVDSHPVVECPFFSILECLTQSQDGHQSNMNRSFEQQTGRGCYRDQLSNEEILGDINVAYKYSSMSGNCMENEYRSEGTYNQRDDQGRRDSYEGRRGSYSGWNDREERREESCNAVWYDYREAEENTDGGETEDYFSTGNKYSGGNDREERREENYNAVWYDYREAEAEDYFRAGNE